MVLLTLPRFLVPTSLSSLLFSCQFSWTRYSSSSFAFFLFFLACSPALIICSTIPTTLLQPIFDRRLTVADHPGFRVDRRAIHHSPHSRFLTRSFEFRTLAFSVITRSFFPPVSVLSRRLRYHILHSQFRSFHRRGRAARALHHPRDSVMAG